MRKSTARKLVGTGIALLLSLGLILLLVAGSALTVVAWMFNPWAGIVVGLIAAMLAVGLTCVFVGLHSQVSRLEREMEGEEREKEEES